MMTQKQEGGGYVQFWQLHSIYAAHCILSEELFNQDPYIVRWIQADATTSVIECRSSWRLGKMVINLKGKLYNMK